MFKCVLRGQTAASTSPPPPTTTPHPRPPGPVTSLLCLQNSVWSATRWSLKTGLLQFWRNLHPFVPRHSSNEVCFCADAVQITAVSVETNPKPRCVSLTQGFSPRPTLMATRGGVKGSDGVLGGVTRLWVVF